jgi:gamma-glutamyltranspeptidase / glutathione hydrolase
VSPLLDAYFRLYSAPLAETASGQRFIQQAGSSTPKIGDLFIQNDLAQTLRAVSSSGPSYMYSGKWGRDYVTAVRAAGGAAELADMEQYRPHWSEAVFSTLNGNAIAISGESFGALQIREALNLAEELRVDKMAPYWQDPQSFLALSRILRWVQGTAYDPGAIDRLRMQGIDASPARRMTKAYARAVAPLVGLLYCAPPADTSSHHSAAVVAVDRWGNVAALVHTANSVIWGSTGFVVDGVPIPDAAAVNAAQLAHVVPGQRVANEMSPLIAIRNGKPVLAIATIGSSLISETMRLLVGLLGNGVDLPSVTAAPPLLLNIEPGLSGERPEQYPLHVPSDAYSSDFLARLHAADVNVQERSKQQVAAIKGTAAVVAIDVSSGTRRSAETPGIFSFTAAE